MPETSESEISWLLGDHADEIGRQNLKETLEVGGTRPRHDQDLVAARGNDDVLESKRRNADAITEQSAA